MYLRAARRWLFALTVLGLVACGRSGPATEVELGLDDVLAFSGEALIELPLTEQLAATAKGITVSMWVVRRAPEHMALVAHAYPTFFLGFHYRRFKWQIWQADGGRTTCMSPRETRAELNRPYHVAASYDGNYLKLYVDGEEICSDWSTGGDIAMPAQPFTVGGYLAEDGGTVDLVDGEIADLRIFAGALDAEAVAELAATPPSWGSR